MQNKTKKNVDFQNWREEDEGKTNKKIIIQKQK
jgi:hypothetical protein